MSDTDNPYGGNSPYGGGVSYGGTSSGYSTGGSMKAGVSPAAKPAAASATPDFVPPTPKPTAPAGGVKDITTQSFMADVIEASRNGPVVVDFWAPWCGPCKQLGPIIEKVAASTPGVTLCKMDVEKYPEVSQQMGVQSIPAVVAFIDGRPADAFMGAKGEREVQAFFDKVAAKAPNAGQGDGENMTAALEEADGLAGTGQHAEAAELYAAILAKEPGNLDAFAGLGQCYVAVGEIDMAQMLIDKVPDEHRSEGPLAALIKTIELARQGSELGELSGLADAVTADPKNHQARFDYALALNANGDREEAAEQLIEIVKADRAWNEDGARTQLLQFFEAWGNMDPATLSGRRALSSILFS